MTQNQIWSEDPHDNAIHKIWEFPNLDGFFSGNGLYQSFSRLGPKSKISEESPNCWIPWHCTIVSTARIVPGHYMPLPQGPRCGISCNCPKASYDITLRDYMSLHQCITCCSTPSHAITASDATAPSKASSAITPRSTCHCTKVLDVITPRAKP